MMSGGWSLVRGRPKRTWLTDIAEPTRIDLNSNIPRQLRSSTSQQLYIPRTKLNMDKGAFSVAAPIIWNELQTTLRYCESLASFHNKSQKITFKNCFSTLNSRRPLKLMTTHVCPRLLNIQFCFVALLSSGPRG